MITKALKTSYHFHPLEVGFVGYSGSGKTTLISKLLSEFSKDQQRVGYVKHDAHRFDMDRPGKDTDIASKSGAALVYISNHSSSAQFFHSTTEDRLNAAVSGNFLDADFVFVEGYKELGIPKTVLLDKENKILDQILKGTIGNILAVIGQEKTAPIELPINFPYFQRDSVSEIKIFIEEYLRKLAETPLFGLVLAGGKSKRMGQDKALLDYHGQPQAEVALGLISQVTERSFLSARPGQWQKQPASQTFNQKNSKIFDLFTDMGPLGGILSAMPTHPKAAWLVVACDLPLLDIEALKKLVRARDSFRFATAYQTDLPEPLCAIYEPKFYSRLLAFLSQKILCPRKILMHSRVKLIDPSTLSSLKNANTPAEYKSIKEEIYVNPQ